MFGLRWVNLILKFILLEQFVAQFVPSGFVGYWELDRHCSTRLCDICFVGIVQIRELNDGSLRVTIDSKPDDKCCDHEISINSVHTDDGGEMFTISALGAGYVFQLTGPENFELIAPVPDCDSSAHKVQITPKPTAPPTAMPTAGASIPVTTPTKSPPTKSPPTKSPPATNPPAGVDSDLLGIWEVGKLCETDECGCCFRKQVTIIQQNGELHVNTDNYYCNTTRMSEDFPAKNFDQSHNKFEIEAHGETIEVVLRDKDDIDMIHDDTVCNSHLTRMIISGLRVEELAIAVFAGVTVITAVILYFVFRTLYPPARNALIFRAAFAFLDFVTDCAFVVEMFSEFPDLAYVSLAFVTFPALVNIFLLLRVFVFEATNKEMKTWFRENSAVATGIMMLASTKLDTVTLLYSGILNLDMFKMPISPISQVRVEWYGIFGNILEDIPQFAVQMKVVALSLSDSHRSNLSAIVVLAIVVTVITIIFEIIRRSALHLIHYMDLRRGSSIGTTDNFLVKPLVYFDHSAALNGPEAGQHKDNVFFK